MDNGKPERTVNVSMLSTQEGFAIGTMVGPYRILRRIGKGGMGVVYEAEHTLLHQRFAIKTLTLQDENAQEGTDRFLLEARITAQLRHECIVSVQTLDVDKETGILYFAMEYVAMSPARREALLRSAIADGKAWEQRFSEVPGEELRPLSLEDVFQYASKHQQQIHPLLVWRILLDVSAALQAAHAFGAGVIHRDIKPANILIRPNGRAVVADFGVAKIVGQRFFKKMLHNREQSLSLRVEADGASYHMILGTMEYLAPELHTGSPPSPQTDLYALGVVAYQLLTGELVSAHAKPPSAYGCARSWDGPIMGCLQPNPAKRWRDVGAFRNELLRLPARLRWRRWVRALRVVPALLAFGAGFLLYFLVALGRTAPPRDGLWLPKLPTASPEVSASTPATVAEAPKPSTPKSVASAPTPAPSPAPEPESAQALSSAQKRDIAFLASPLSVFTEGAFRYALLKERNGLLLKGVVEGASLPNPLRIPEQVRGLPVRIIGSEVFQNHKGLDTVILPKSLFILGEAAFCESSLRKIALQEGLQRINAYAFKGTKLEQIDLPDSVFLIGTGAFQNTPLREVPKFPDALKYLDPRPFVGCSFRPGSTLTLPPTFGHVPLTLLWYVSGVSAIHLPGVKNVFSGGLVGLARDIPGRKLTITFGPHEVFFRKGSIASATSSKVVVLAFPKGGKPRFEDGFGVDDNTALQLEIEGQEVQHWKDGQWAPGPHPVANTWKSDPSLPNFLWRTEALPGGGILLSGYEGSCTGTLTIPSHLDGKAVLALGNRLCQGLEAREVVVQEGVRALGSLAFARMGKLKRAILPASIEWSPSFEMPNHSKDANHLFQFCSQLEEVVMRSSPKQWPYACFSHCPKLKRVWVMAGSALPKYNRYAFEDTDPKGTIVTLSKTAQHYRCWANGNVTPEGEKGLATEPSASPIPPVVAAEGAQPMAPHTTFSEGILSYTVQEDGQGLIVKGFAEGVAESDTLRIPERVRGLPVRVIGQSAFDTKPWLRTVILPETLRTVQSYAFRETPITKLVLPEGVRHLDDFAFKGTKLTEVTLPGTLELLGRGCFQNTPLRDMPAVPDGLKNMRPLPFIGCVFSGKTVFRYPGSLTTIPRQLLWYTYGLTELVVPGVTEVHQRTLVGLANRTPGQQFTITFGQRNVLFRNGSIASADSSKVIVLAFPKGAKPRFEDGFKVDDNTALQLEIVGEATKHWKEGQWVPGPHPIANTWRPDPYLPNFYWRTEKLPGGGLLLSGYEGSCTGTLTIPSHLDGEAVLALGDGLCFTGIKARELVVQEGIVSLGAFTFARMSKLKRATLPASIEWLSSLDVPKQKGNTRYRFVGWDDPKHKTDARRLFAGCSQLEEVVLHSSPEQWPLSCFVYCSKLKCVWVAGDTLPRNNSATFDHIGAEGTLVRLLQSKKAFRYWSNGAMEPAYVEPMEPFQPALPSASSSAESDEEPTSSLPPSTPAQVRLPIAKTGAVAHYECLASGDYELRELTSVFSKLTLSIPAVIEGRPVVRVAPRALAGLRFGSELRLEGTLEFAPSACPIVSPKRILYPKGQPPLFSCTSFPKGLPRFVEQGSLKQRKLLASDGAIQFLRTATGCLVYHVTSDGKASLTIPETFGTLPVEGILPGALKSCNTIETLIVEGKQPKRLWEDSFQGCDKLFKITIATPYSSKEIASNLFKHSKNTSCTVHDPRTGRTR